MKILFAMRHVDYFRHFETPIRELAKRGHTIEVFVGVGKKKDSTPTIAIERAIADYPTIHYHEAPNWHETAGYWQKFSRHYLGYLAYLKPNHPASEDLHIRWLEAFKGRETRYLARPLVKWILGLSSTEWAFRWIHRLRPTVASVKAIVAELQPDIVIASPYLTALPTDAEFVRAARELHIPTIYALTSWDNLTTKGTYADPTDFVFMWNEPLKREAQSLHGIPVERITLTGAPYFDHWFGHTSSESRTAFCKSIGLDPNRPYLLYLCSSTFIAKNEQVFLTKVIQELQHSPYAVLQQLQILVRPHPVNTTIWDSIENSEQMVIYPRGANLTDIEENRQILYDSIYHSMAVMGINTSAFLEAAIVDRPCLTLLDDSIRTRQTDLPHFQHLLDGDFLEVASNTDELFFILLALLNGTDLHSQQRRQFVQDFLRPQGLETPVAVVMADAIERCLAMYKGN
jgi:hypothetical protein